MPSAAGGAPSRHSNIRASGPPSNPRPEREVNSTGDFLSNACSRTRWPWQTTPSTRPTSQ
jgi:hypothetical protein